MEKKKIRKENGAMIPLLQDIPAQAEKIIIMIHGLESCKECDTGKMLFRRMLPEGIGVIAYDQPGHGSEEARDEWFTLQACMESLKTVEDYAAEKWPQAEILYFASSFGAYMTSLYISQREHRGSRLFLRSAAVNMPEMFLGKPGSAPDPAALELLEKQGYLQPSMGIGTPVRVPKQMFEELRENDLFQKFAPGSTPVMMVHGDQDMVISPDAARAFAAKFKLPLAMFEGEGHSLCTAADTPDKVADMALDFFRKPLK